MFSSAFCLVCRGKEIFCHKTSRSLYQTENGHKNTTENKPLCLWSYFPRQMKLPKKHIHKRMLFMARKQRGHNPRKGSRPYSVKLRSPQKLSHKCTSFLFSPVRRILPNYIQEIAHMSSGIWAKFYVGFYSDRLSPQKNKATVPGPQ